MKTANNTNGKRILALFVCAIVVCAALVTAVFAISAATNTEPMLDIYATNLSFSDSIYIKYAVSHSNVTNADNVKLLVWTSPMANYEDYVVGSQNTTLSAVGTKEINGTECLIFDYKSLAAKQMTDYVYARACYTVGGKDYYSEVKKYSILTYVYNKLGYTGTATSNETLEELLRGLLEYGASAQNYFDYNLNTLATDKHVKVTLDNGTFADGFNTTLAKVGTRLTITASNAEGKFLYWTDASGDIVSYDKSYEITVGNQNTTLSAVYATFMGGDVVGAGANLEAGSFALTEHTVNTDNSTEITASSLQAQLSGLASGSIYRITDGNVLNITSSVNGNGAVIIAPAGVTISDSVSVSDLIVIGSVSVKGSNGVSFNRVEIQSTDTALSVDSASKNVSLDDCRLISDTTAVSTSAFNTTVKNSYINGNSGAVSNANETTVYNCSIFANTLGVSITGEDSAVNNNDITVGAEANGIYVGENAINSLVTYNVIEGPKDAIKVSGATNTVILFNSAYNVAAENSTNTYVVKNSLGGDIVLTNNNYLLCDENTDADGEPYRTTAANSNENMNGDSLMDVDSRDDVAGADEHLLPHTNKDLFIDPEVMPRKTYVKDVAGGTSLSLDDYIQSNATTGSVVIVPPGAYSTAKGERIFIKNVSDVEVYAFGVYNEHEFITNKEFVDTANIDYKNVILHIESAENVTVHGLWNAYNYQSSGQVHVLEKLGNNQVLVVPAAGYDLDLGFGKSNPDIFRSDLSFYLFDGSALADWCSVDYNYVSTNEDGTIVLEIIANQSADSLDNVIYDMIKPGDVFCTRMAGDNQSSVSISKSSNILLKDCILNGYSAALAHVAGGTGVKLERVHNLAKAPYVIDETTYNWYDSLEDTYGIDLEIYQDELGRYRGSKPRFGSVDATHINNSKEGVSIESCIFENSCDDGSNQRGNSYRLHSIVANADGETATITYKGILNQIYHSIYYSQGKTDVNLSVLGFAKGENVYIYTSEGGLVCDTECLTNSKGAGSFEYTLSGITYTVNMQSFTVPLESVNFDALEGYDLSDNHYDLTNKVFVDNINLSSAGFTADNLVVRDSHARGILAKTVNATIKNCTFQNIKGTGVLLSCEHSWGESTVSRNITVDKCLFDSTGFSNYTWDKDNAPIYIYAANTYGKANIDTLRADNITITGCEFRNYGHNYGIYVNGAQNVKIKDNVFYPMYDSNQHFIEIKTAIDIEISGNTYKDSSGEFKTISGVVADDYANIYGSDVEGQFKADCDIYIAGTHISEYRVAPADVSNKDVAEALASKLSEVCGYSLSHSTFYDTNIVKLVIDPENSLVSNSKYLVNIDGTNLVITAATKNDLIYAVEDFANYIVNNKVDNSISFNEGFSINPALPFSIVYANDTETFKYSGLWSANGTSMVSVADADYVEFDVTGTGFTLLFSDTTEFDLMIDGEDIGTYTAESEMTFSVVAGTHTVRVLCKDTDNKINFAGVKYHTSNTISRTADKAHYVQFIGDSMVDGDDSFAHTVGDLLGWDYSVIVGDTIPPSTDTGRTPDLIFIFLGTDAITSSSTDNEISTFKTTYKNLINSVISKYPNYTKIYLMQALSTSDANDMYNTSSNRYSAIASMKSYSNWSFMTNTKIQLIDATTVQGWGVEFDTSVDTTNPTALGKYTLMCKVANYVSDDVGYSNSNYQFPLSSMVTNNTSSFPKTEMTENGITFNRYSFGSAGHVFVNGNNYAWTTNASNASDATLINSGHYLVFKYRTIGDNNIALDLRTNDVGTDQLATVRVYNDDDSSYLVNYFSSNTKPVANITADVWEVAVVDLSVFANYTTGLDNIGVQVRFTTSSEQLDIAGVGIVDSIAQAENFIKAQFADTEYTYYARWNQTGVTTSLLP